jgi:sulfur-carrier protein
LLVSDPCSGPMVAQRKPGNTMADMARLRLLGPAREAAGVSSENLPGTTVIDVLHAARCRYGAAFCEILDHSQIWLNGEPVEDDRPVGVTDELAVLPPVSGG